MGQYRISQRAEAISIFDKTFKQLRSVLCRCRNRFHSLNLKVRHSNFLSFLYNTEVETFDGSGTKVLDGAEKDSDKDGWDDIEPLEQPKPSPAVANIQSAQKHPMSQPVSQPKPQATSLRPKSTVKVAKVEDNDL
ncbi:hypothetical protein V6N12_063418 [Hibiscus sabdariffa]|uniref:Uncharacterized protein n=1 Tax=Hibiscus sabdariffa TaxID=183260 RepID=A0ABR2FBZ8_9ROSI